MSSGATDEGGGPFVRIRIAPRHTLSERDTAAKRALEKAQAEEEAAKQKQAEEEEAAEAAFLAAEKAKLSVLFQETTALFDAMRQRQLNESATRIQASARGRLVRTQ